MRKSILLFILLCSTKIFSQTTITAGSYTPVTGTTFSTGITYITFAVRNNNPYPIVLTNLTALQANLYENNTYSLWYSSSSLGGAPTVTSPTWNLITTSLYPFTSSVIAPVTPFDCIGFTIPANTTYRFALKGTEGTACRGNTAAPNTLSPNIFSAGGVDLLCGDFILPGQAARVGYFGWQVLGNSGTSYYFDGSITFIQAPAYTDIYIKSITKPSSVCNSNNSFVSALLCNKSPQSVNLGTNNVTMNYSIVGPTGTQSLSLPINSGTLQPCGCLNAAIAGVDFSNPGNYQINATASIAGVTDINLTNNSYNDSLTNYKPTVSPDDSICQYSNPGVYSGMTASNCLSRNRTFTLNTTLSSTPPADGSSDATAGLFATTSLPSLPEGSVITGGKLIVENLNGVTYGTWGNEARFNIYGANPNGPSNPFVPALLGNTLAFSVYSFDYSIPITGSQFANMYNALGAGGTINIGYWETLDDLVAGSDVELNPQGTNTTVKIIIEYTINPISKWYTTSFGGSSISNNSNFNPFLVTGSGLTNTNISGNYTFYAACSADTICRVPVSLKINPSPVVNQDTLKECELISSTGNAIFDLTTTVANVSNGNPLASVSFYQDQGLTQLISNPNNFNTSSTIVFSKVELGGGCYASDSVILEVISKPDFASSNLTGFVCTPNCIDAAVLINPFSTVPFGTDTLYYEDNGFSIPHPNPHNICQVDTVYMVFLTNTNPGCSDTATAYIDVSNGGNEIIGQVTPGNFSACGPLGTNIFTLTDGNSDTLRNSADCKKVAAVYDIPNGTSLGSISVNEDIDCSFPLLHNGQPYVNRSYQITPTNSDTAMVCLYYLDDDFAYYNNAAFPNWPLLPTGANQSLTTNLCISKVDNGDLNTPGHTAIAIPNSQITTSYDPNTTVWTVCFPVSSFSYFYCHSCNPSNTPLPVILTDFKGRRVNETSELTWTTKTEINNSHFIIERSRDARTFNAISTSIPTKALNGTSSSELNYAYTDNTPMQGHNYYRLAQYDIDGKQSLSDVVDVYFGDETIVTMYPNPVNTELSIDINTPKATNASVKIMDATGRVVRSLELQLSVGMNHSQVDLHGLADGIYMVNVSNRKGLNYNQSIIKK